MSKKHNAQSLEFGFTADTFNLERETTEDGEKTAKELERARQAKIAAARLQMQMKYGDRRAIAQEQKKKYPGKARGAAKRREQRMNHPNTPPNLRH